MCIEELTGRVCAIDLEAFVWAREFLDETEVVKCGRDVEEFRVETKLSSGFRWYAVVVAIKIR